MERVGIIDWERTYKVGLLNELSNVKVLTVLNHALQIAGDVEVVGLFENQTQVAVLTILGVW
jgi:hypothetical protein